ncbi:hypothetical protein [Chryseobacterium taklimakanense]|nr:hypothetical protein [Chryseobacterium taklimakanense]
MKKIIILLLMPTVFYTQVKTDLEAFNNSRGSVFDVTNTNFKSYQGIDGSPYFNEHFLPITVDGYNKHVPNVRYNAYEDEMEFQNGNNLNYVIKSGDMRIIFTGLNKVYVLRNYILDGTSTNGYLVEVVKEIEDKFGLYKKEQIHIVEYNNNTTNSYLKQQNPKFEKKRDVFIVLYKGNYFKLPKSQKELKSWFQYNIPSVDVSRTKDFVKKNNINFTKEDDVKKFITFLNA